MSWRRLATFCAAALATSCIVVVWGPHRAAADTDLRLPWRAGVAWNITQGRHTTNAWDFQPPGAGSHNDEVVAVADGTARVTCADPTGQVIIDLTTAVGTFRYLHLDGSAVAALGITSTLDTPVRRGQVIARLHPGPPGKSQGCGYSRPAGASHLHLQLPTTPLTLQGIAFSSSGPGRGSLVSTNDDTSAVAAPLPPVTPPPAPSATPPFGDVNDLRSPTPGQLTVTGWAVDPDAMTSAVSIVVDVGGEVRDLGPAGLARPDVAAFYPGSGETHGFSTTFETTKSGPQPVTVTAVSLGGGPNTVLRTATIDLGVPSPQGYLDDLVSSTPGTLTARGWALDASDVTTKIEVKASIGGPAGAPGAQLVSLGPASTARPDVEQFLPGVGSEHGFETTVATTKTGSQTIYVYAMNIGTGSNTELGSRTLLIAPPNRVPAMAPLVTPGQSVTMQAKALRRRSVLSLDVDPNWAGGAYTGTIQRLEGARWRPVTRMITLGTEDTWTMNLPRGSYRAVVSRPGFTTGTSATVTLRR